MFRSARIRVLLLIAAGLGGLAAALFAVLFGAQAAAADPTCTIWWAGTNSTDWGTNANWASSDGGGGAGRVPGSSDFVCMETTPARTAVVYSTGTKTVAGIKFTTAGSSLSITGGSLTANTNASTVQALTLNGGTLTGTSAIAATSLDFESGTLSSTVTTGSYLGNGGVLTSAKTLTITGPATLCSVQLDHGYRLLLQGASTLDSSACSYVYLQNGSKLENAGTFTVSGNNNGTSYYVIDDGTAASFVNDAGGTVNVAMSSVAKVADVQTSFSNLGAVSVTTGTMQVFGGEASGSPNDSGSYAISAGSSVQLGSGTRSVTGTVTGAGSLVLNGATVTFGSGVAVPVLDLEGGTVSGSPSVSALTFNAGTLTGSGTLTSTGTATLCGATLDNGYRLLLQGTSTLDSSACSYVYLQNGSKLENAGTFTVSGNNNGTSYYVIDDGTAASFVNDAGGTVNVAMSSVAKVADVQTSFSNLGAVSVTTGTMQVFGGEASGSPNDSGSYAISAGSSVQLGSGTRSVTGTVTGAGSLVLNGATVTFGSGVAVPVLDLEGGTVSGSPSVSALTFNAGTLTGSGTLTSTGTATLCGATLDNGYRLLLQGTSTLDSSACSYVYLQNGSKLENAGTFTVSGNNNGTSYYVIDDGTAASFVNDAGGTVNIGMSSASSQADTQTSVTNNGTIAVTKGNVNFFGAGITNESGAGKLTGGTWVANGGTMNFPVQVTNNAATITLGSTGAFAPNLTNLSTNSGTLSLAQSVTSAVALTNSGFVGLDNNATYSVKGFTQTAGTTIVHAGSTLKSANAGATVAVNGGTLAGDGTVVGNVSGTGTVNPGNNNTGTLTVTGTYSSAPSGVLVVNGGSTQLAASGAATLGGTLQLNTPNGVPALGTTVTVLTASSVTGTFATLINQDLPSVGGYWTINYTATSVTATVTPYPVISPSNASAAEGNSGTSTLNVPVNLDHASPFPTTVSYATADGTATAGSDYVATSGSLVFAPGQTNKSIAVTINGDALYEHDETFTVTLTGPDHGTLGNPATATATITNDDPAPTISVADAGASVNAAGGATISFPVTLSTASGVDASVTYATADGTAIAGTDYTAESGTLTILAGSTSATISVPVAAQTNYATPKTFTVSLSAPVDTTIGTGTATGTITNTNPNIASVSPSKLYTGVTTSVTINGANFSPSATVAVSGTKVTVSQVVVVNPQQITAKFATSTTASPGARSVTVTDPGIGTATCTNCVTVHASPTVTSLAPPTLSRGAPAAVFTLTGTNFVSGATIGLTPTTGTKVTNVTVVNSTTITFKASAVQKAALGSYKVKVANSDGGQATCSCLTVVGPQIASFAPGTIKRGIATAVTISGTGFDPAGTVDVGCPLSNTTITATSITTTVTCDGKAVLGTHVVTVTDTDGSSYKCKHCMTLVGPNITAITPSSVARGASASLTVTGTGFVAGTQLSSPSCTFSATTVTDSHTMTTTITCPANAPLGKLTITVTNPDGSLGSFNGFTVTE